MNSNVNNRSGAAVLPSPLSCNSTATSTTSCTSTTSSTAATIRNQLQPPQVKSAQQLSGAGAGAGTEAVIPGAVIPASAPPSAPPAAPPALLPSAPPQNVVSSSAPTLNAASLARMLPPPQMISSAANPFAAHPIMQYGAPGTGTGATGISVHQMFAANPGWGYGLQSQLMANTSYQMPAPALIPSYHGQVSNRMHMMHPHHYPHHYPQHHHHHPHIQPHPNAMLSSLAVAQAYQTNMAASGTSTQIVSNHGTYRDLAKDACNNDPDNEGDASGVKYQSFTVKLQRILADDEFADCICWMPHGRSWKVLKQEEFEERVIPLFYRHGKFASFMRQVNGWGFQRMSTGPEKNSYYHEMFLRGFPNLSSKMRRPLNKAKSASPEPKTHPNFQDSKSFVFLPMLEKSIVVSDSNQDLSCSDSNGFGGFDTDTSNNGTTSDAGSGSDRVSLNMANLCGSSSSGGSDRESNDIYGSGGSDQGSNLYASGGSDQGLRGIDQGFNSGENTSSNGDQDSSNGNTSDGTGSENGCDGEKNDDIMVSIISGVVDGVEMESSSSELRNMSGAKMSSRILSSSETDETSSSSLSRNKHHRSASSFGSANSKPQSIQARRPSMAAPTAKRPRLSPSTLGAQQQIDASETSSSGSETSPKI